MKIKILGITVFSIEEDNKRKKNEDRESFWDQEGFWCDDEDGYSGPRSLLPQYKAGINPRCGKPLSECSFGMGHAHLD